MTPFGKEPSSPSPSPSPQPRSGQGVTVIARETRLAGELTGTRGVRIEGTVTGTVDLKAPFEVIEGARVEAEVNATSVKIGGTVVGNVTATEVVELLASSVVKGDITTPTLHVVEGAKLEGRVQMRLDERSARPLAPGKDSQKTEQQPDK